MDNSWVTQIEPNVVTYIDAGLTEIMDILVTSDDFTGDTAEFPSVHIRELSQVERGYDLEGNTINGVLSTFQIDVYDTNYQDCKEISTRVMLLMKELRFEVIQSPLHTQMNGYYRSVSRYRRLIGGEDKELITDEQV